LAPRVSIPGVKVSRFIVFDFDGVLADSEVLSNKVLAQMVSELGVPTTLEDSFRLYMGKRFDELIAAVEAAVGRPLPGFADDYPRRIAESFRRDLRPVDGAHAFLEAFADLPRCIASSSSPDRLALSIDVLGFKPMFGAHVFSASQVARGKPHPDIFLFAAERMGLKAAHGIVIEDSASGVEAGLAAGMTVIGLVAASHIRDGHAERLKKAGAHHIAATFAEAEDIMRGLLA
jgi:HAD superfamily hydrolase (TIGR01509 family)